MDTINMTLYVVITESRIKGNFTLYPEVFDNLNLAMSYMNEYINKVCASIKESKFNVVQENDYIKTIEFQDSDDYIRLEVFEKQNVILNI